MKIVVASDFHNSFPPALPDGDVLIYAGDLTEHGFRVETYKFLVWIEEQKDKFKEVLVIAGNHDLYIEKHLEEVKNLFLNIGCFLLHNEEFILFNGIKVWGSPFTLKYHDWAFNKNESSLYDLWETIPQDTQILVTHSPPRGILDKSKGGDHLGSADLRNKVREVKPKLHIFGHVHESKGSLFLEGIRYINASNSVFVVDWDTLTIE